MGFLRPKMPTAGAAPKPANLAMDPLDPAIMDEGRLSTAASSLISTSSRGLTRKARTQRTSLIGGSQ